MKSGDVLAGLYEIVRELGQGGTGVIYLAYHMRLKKYVVVKKIKDGYTGVLNDRGEVDILKQLHHSYLPQVYDFVVLNQSVYTVMEFIEGHDLQYYLDLGYEFPEETLRIWMIQLAQVLQYLHSQKPAIYHSDIKPANIMVTKEGNICLIDFGISLDGTDGYQIKGISQWYAAPEQFEMAQNYANGISKRKKLDGRMDIYSLGAVFFRILTGCFPDPQREFDITKRELPYSNGLKAIVTKCIKQNPKARFQTAKSLENALERIQKMDPRYRKYQNWQYIVLVIYICLVISGGFFIAYGNWQLCAERFHEEYETYYLFNEQEDEENIIMTGISILNNSKYQSYLKRNPQSKAEVLAGIAESYFRQEQYAEASDYYQEAYQCSLDDLTYYRGYIISLIRANEIEKAQTEINAMPKGSGLTEAEKIVINAELQYLSGLDNEETKKAEIQLDNIISGKIYADKILMKEAFRTRVDRLCKKENYIQAVEILMKEASMFSDRDVHRKLGNVASMAAEQDARTRTHYLYIAFDEYKKLVIRQERSFEDQLNLALIARALGRYEESNLTLMNLERKESDDYRVYMWMCYNYLNIGSQADDFTEVKIKLREAYQKCERLFRELGKPEDENMEILIHQIEAIGDLDQ